MSFYLVYERCADCVKGDCFQCVQPQRQLALRAVQADSPPQNSINGPCETPQDLLAHMAKFFDFDPETGLMFFRAWKGNDV